MSLQIPHETSKVHEHVSLSLGIGAMIPGSGNSPEDLIAEADGALYQAKAKGRNQSFCKSPI